jgi:hypothetical protein
MITFKRTALATLLLLARAFSAKAQTTTYTIPTGKVCSSSVEGCNYENLTSTQADGTVLYGRFEAGGYWTQFQYEAFAGQNPGYKAQYCNSTEVSTQPPLTAPTTMDCNASADQTSQDGPVQIHVVIDAHFFVATYTCGVRVRYVCHATRWMVDDGLMTISSTSSI